MRHLPNVAEFLSKALATPALHEAFVRKELVASQRPECLAYTISLLALATD